MADLKARIPVGGIREAIVRAFIYVGMGRGRDAARLRGGAAHPPRP